MFVRVCRVDTLVPVFGMIDRFISLTASLFIQTPAGTVYAFGLVRGPRAAFPTWRRPRSLLWATGSEPPVYCPGRFLPHILPALHVPLCVATPSTGGLGGRLVGACECRHPAIRLGQLVRGHCSGSNVVRMAVSGALEAVCRSRAVWLVGSRLLPGAGTLWRPSAPPRRVCLSAWLRWSGGRSYYLPQPPLKSSSCQCALAV